MKESGQQETEDPKLDQSFRKGIIMQRYTWFYWCCGTIDNTSLSQFHFNNF